MKKEKHFLNFLLIQSNIDWLNCNNPAEIINAIHKGTSAILSILKFLMQSICPILQAIGSLIIMYNYIKPYCSIVSLFLLLIFTIGTKILVWEFNQRSEISLQTNPLSSYNVHLSNSFLPRKEETRSITGMGERFPDKY